MSYMCTTYTCTCIYMYTGQANHNHNGHEAGGCPAGESYMYTDHWLVWHHTLVKIHMQLTLSFLDALSGYHLYLLIGHLQQNLRQHVPYLHHLIYRCKYYTQVCMYMYDYRGSATTTDVSMGIQNSDALPV